MLKKVISCTACATLFFACSDGSIINVNDEAKDKANISFLVLDSYSGEAIDSVEIYRSKDSKTNLTDSLGYSVWKKNAIGNYVFELSKEGYATIRTSVDVVEEGLGDVARVPDVTATVPMYKLGAEVNGTILYTDKETKNKVPAADVTVIITNLNRSIIPNEMSVKTDKNGNYSFSQLPEASSFLITVPQTSIDGNKYEVISSTSVPAQRAGATVDLGVQNLTLVTSDFSLVNSNTNKIDTNTTVTLSFSTILDKDSVIKNIKVLKGNISVLTQVSLSTDNKTISIKPFSGSWEDNKNYTISGAVYSSNGSYLNVNKSFTVGGTTTTRKPGQIDELKVELDGSYLDISWTRKDSLATGYSIYYKNDSMSNYLMYTKLSSGNYTSTSISYSNLLNDDAETTTVNIIVLPYNKAGEADAKRAESVSYTFAAPTAQVSNLSVELKGSYAYIDWDAPTTGSYDYRIYYKTPSMDEYVVLTTTISTYYETNYTISNYLESGDESISFKVVPYDDFGESSLSKAVAATLSLAIDVVAGVAAEIDGSYFKVSWNNLANASYYYVYYKTSSMTSYSRTTSTSSLYKNFLISSYVESGDTSISFKVIASNAANEGVLADAEEVTIEYPSGPEVITGMTAELDVNVIALNWSAPETGIVKGYYLYYKTSSMTDYLRSSSNPTTTSVNINKALYTETTDTDISFKVTAYNDFGESSIDDTDPVTVDLSTTPDPL